ncbi:hypothetical protein CVT25_012421 [Psilocybe cyanescens]|uniref:Uncharacterized protein n=1 Tax=Psilocybe cyanescens TaxID=93625 RepID=A0A409X7R0_PSICY|nr:hypothetical protein CVT25_012421 [Psilocybe cyanescens]
MPEHVSASLSPRKASTYNPQRGYALRQPTSNLAYSCINASDLHSPKIPILLPKQLLENLYPNAQAWDLAEIPPLCSIWDNDGDESRDSTFSRTQRIFPSSLIPTAVPWPKPCSISPECTNGTLKQKFCDTLPHDLWAVVVSGSTIQYAQDTGTLRVTIGGTEPPSAEEVECELAPWKEDAWVSTVSIVVSDSVTLASFFKAAPYKAVLWILTWLQGAHGNTIETIRVSLPMRMPSSKKTDIPTMLSSIVLDDDEGTKPASPSRVYPALKTLYWRGDSRLLPKLLPSLASHNTRTLTLASDLSIPDALWVLRHFSSSRLHTLDLATLVVDPRPTLNRPEDNTEKIGRYSKPAYSKSRERPLPPFALPYLDTLTISSSVPFHTFLAQIAMPRLCSVFLVLNGNDVEGSLHSRHSGKYGTEEILHSFLADPSVRNHKLLFVGVRCGLAPERAEHIEGLVRQRVSPDAVVKVC